MTIAIQFVDNHVFHEHTKHIEINCHFIRERIQQLLTKTICIHKTDQQANLLTKALGRVQHDILTDKLGLLNLFSLRGVMKLAND